MGSGGGQKRLGASLRDLHLQHPEPVFGGEAGARGHLGFPAPLPPFSDPQAGHSKCTPQQGEFLSVCFSPHEHPASKSRACGSQSRSRCPVAKPHLQRKLGKPVWHCSCLPRDGPCPATWRSTGAGWCPHTGQLINRMHLYYGRYRKAEH